MKIIKEVLISSLLIGVIFLLANCGPSEPKNTLEKVKREKKLIIATHPVNPPFEFGSGTGVDGFDFDLAEAIAHEMGVKTQWLKKQFDKCFEYLKTGDADMVINAVTITPERKKEYLFSIPYFETGQIIAVWGKNNTIKTADDLVGKKVGVQKNTTAEQFLLDKGKGEIDIVEFDSFDDALFELNRKLLDAVVGDAPTLQYDLKMLTHLKTVGGLLTKEQYGIVFRKNEVEMKKEVDKIIKKLKNSGEFDKLLKKWNLQELSPKTDIPQKPSKEKTKK